MENWNCNFSKISVRSTEHEPMWKCTKTVVTALFCRHDATPILFTCVHAHQKLPIVYIQFKTLFLLRLKHDHTHNKPHKTKLNNDEKSTKPAEKFFHSDEIQRHKNILREKKTQRVCTFISIHYFVWVAFSHSRLNHVFGLVWIVYGFFTEFLRSQLITFFCFIVKIWNIAV